jgi:hypothetical protein
MALCCTLRLWVKREALSAPIGEVMHIRSADKFLSRIFVYSPRFAY